MLPFFFMCLNPCWLINMCFRLKLVMSVRELGGRWARQLQSFTQYPLSRLGIIWASTLLGRLLHPHMVTDIFLPWATTSPSLCRLLPWNQNMPQESPTHFSRYESEQRLETCRHSYMVLRWCITQLLQFLSCYSWLLQLFMTFGLPKVITSDQGREFNNSLDTELMKTMGINHRLTTPYHPQVIYVKHAMFEYLQECSWLTCKLTQMLSLLFNVHRQMV